MVRDMIISKYENDMSKSVTHWTLTLKRACMATGQTLYCQLFNHDTFGYIHNLPLKPQRILPILGWIQSIECISNWVFWQINYFSFYGLQTWILCIKMNCHVAITTYVTWWLNLRKSIVILYKNTPWYVGMFLRWVAAASILW